MEQAAPMTAEGRAQGVWAPALTPLDSDLKPDRENFRVFALMGANSRLLELEEAIRSIPNAELEVGYHPGFLVDRTGLTDFPYDNDRLFQYRVLVFNNAVFDVARFVGMSIMANYLEAGGGLVFGGGDNVFGQTRIDSDHPLYDCLPISGTSIHKRTVRLNSPAQGHPIFRGLDLGDLPYEYYVHEVTLKEGLASEPRVLLKAGDQPVILEDEPAAGRRVMLVLALPYGDPAENPGKRPLYEWADWQRLYANVVRYAAFDL